MSIFTWIQILTFRIEFPVLFRDYHCVALGILACNYFSLLQGELSKISYCIDLTFDSTSLVPFLLSLRVNLSTREFFDNIPWIWLCCKALYWVGAGRIAIALEASLPFNLVSVLIEINFRLRIYLHCCWISRIFYVGFNTDFWILISIPKLCNKNYRASWDIENFFMMASIKSISK